MVECAFPDGRHAPIVDDVRRAQKRAEFLYRVRDGLTGLARGRRAGLGVYGVDGQPPLCLIHRRVNAANQPVAMQDGKNVAASTARC